MTHAFSIYRGPERVRDRPKPVQPSVGAQGETAFPSPPLVTRVTPPQSCLIKLTARHILPSDSSPNQGTRHRASGIELSIIIPLPGDNLTKPPFFINILFFSLYGNGVFEFQLDVICINVRSSLGKQYWRRF